ncbi:NADP-dependent phosphogluconate dehydrogenase [Nitratireductor sp. CAU 1489]|uniref:6-phosphogluconate dehydrogenase, decarboxylating n=1 Tax=Nitratireductor arenosus TaxID=2682096 RepID=A0A844QC52_9HYPH|nr:NADP-dependent phosphogluconate dehydrogenase [Nitratireductor arenosus]MVA96825.1 NADP-dependent phosphogluconate dehydrogenase [Nitratireductor arenosus]
MHTAEIGLIGLGVMGSNLALNIAEKGHRIAVWNRTTETTRRFAEDAGALGAMIVPCDTLADLAAAIRPPRPIILMVPAGAVVDEQIRALRPLLSADDILIDAGNANFRDTMRRFDELDGSGLAFIGMGVSGGEDGARNGPSIMVGGAPSSWLRVKDVLVAVAAQYRGEPCVAHLGSDGAGHFVKTIHNGIEYADMQMIAEVYGLLRDGAGLKAGEMARLFQTWNGGRLESYLVEITASVLATEDPETGDPIVDVILDRAGQKGTGRWAAIEAQTMAVPATAIEAAVAARSLSAMKDERVAAEALYGAPVTAFSKANRRAVIDDLESALYAGKIAAYAQGFAVMEAASREFAWGLPLATVARIWRAGCIIRSQFLDDIARAYDEDAPANLLAAPRFVKAMQDAHPALRRTVARAAAAGIPVPALSAALAYFDTYRTARGTANLIQAQRDYFGAHGFERIDAGGAHHGPWSG